LCGIVDRYATSPAASGDQNFCAATIKCSIAGGSCDGCPCRWVRLIKAFQRLRGFLASFGLFLFFCFATLGTALSNIKADTVNSLSLFIALSLPLLARRRTAVDSKQQALT
jgi:hypothetical protein